MCTQWAFVGTKQTLVAIICAVKKFLAYDFEIECGKIIDFIQADGLSRLINSQRSSGEEAVVASVTVENDVCQVLLNSIHHTPVTADEVCHERANDEILSMAIKFL